MKVRGRFATSFAVIVSLASSSAIAEEAAKEATLVEAGSQVSIEYTLTLDDGKVADTNVGGQPLTYQQGQGQILPALESELLGLGVGATKQVDLTAEQGYGPVDASLYDTVEAKLIPEEAREVGSVLVAQAPNGQQRPVRVHEVKEDGIVLDLNHPLAGQALHFDVKILAID